MISHQHKFIFFHIPKTAGTTIEHFLYPLASESCGGQWAVSNRCWRNKELFDSARDRCDYFSFTIVRNPEDRFISAWNHFHKMENGASIDEFLSMTEMFLAQNPGQLYRELPINETMYRYIEDLGRKRKEGFIYPFSGENTGYHVLPQSYFLQQKMSFVGRFENLDNDFNIIAKNILGNPAMLPHLNKIPHKSYQELLSDTQIAQIRKIYQDDFLALNY